MHTIALAAAEEENIKSGDGADGGKMTLSEISERRRRHGRSLAVKKESCTDGINE